MTKEELIKKVIEEVKDEELKKEILSIIVEKEKKGRISAKDIGFLLEDLGFNMKELGQYTKFQYIWGWIAISILFIIGIGIFINGFYSEDGGFYFIFGSVWIFVCLVSYYQLWLVRRFPDRFKKIGKSD